VSSCRVLNDPRHNLVARGRRRTSTAKHSSRKLTNTRRPTPWEAPSTHGRARSCAPGAASLRTPKTGHAAWRCSTGAVCPGWHSSTHLYRAGSLPCPFRRRGTSQRGCCAAGLPGREAQWMTNRVMALPEAEPVTALARSTGREDCTGCNEGRLTSSHPPQRPRREAFRPLPANDVRADSLLTFARAGRVSVAAPPTVPWVIQLGNRVAAGA
jgi:hypothetical protein